MTDIEASALLERYNVDYREQWERARYTGTVAALTGRIKDKAYEKLITFSWEKQAKEKTVRPTPDKVKALREEYSAAYERYTNGQTETFNPDGKI